MIRVVLAAMMTIALAAPLKAAVEIQEVTSPGGIEAWLVQENSIPFVSLEIRFLGGSSLDPEGKRGVTKLMTGLIEEGAGDLDAAAFAEARDGLAASFEFSVQDDALSVSVRMLTENRDEAVELLRQALVNPRFDEDAVERVRAQLLSGIRTDLTDPNWIANRTFDDMVYGDHPYGSSSDGSLESVAALTRDDVVEAFRAVVARERVHVGASGDISAVELGLLLDRLLGDLPDKAAPLPGPAEVNISGGVTIVPFDTPQAVAFFGQPGIARNDPDFFAAFVANEIFGGGGLQSRLSEEVRVKRGLTYGIGSYLVNFDDADMLLGRFASANDRVAEAIGVVKDEWARIAENGVTEQELDEAKTYLTGAYPLRFDGNGPIARILVGMQTIDLTPEYITSRNENIEAVTLDDIKRVAARLYQPENLRFVVVGQPEGLEEIN